MQKTEPVYIDTLFLKDKMVTPNNIQVVLFSTPGVSLPVISTGEAKARIQAPDWEYLSQTLAKKKKIGKETRCRH